MSENGIPQLIKQLPKLLIYIVFFNHYGNNFYSQSVNIHAAILHSRESRSTVSEHLCLKKKKIFLKKIVVHMLCILMSFHPSQQLTKMKRETN